MVELIAKSYGKALYELAVESDKIKEVEEQIKFIKEIWLKETEFVEILNHPEVNIESKVKMVEEIFSDKILDQILGLIVTTIMKGRQNYLIQILDYCLEKFKEYHKIVTAHITSSVELSEEYQSRIKEKLEMITNKKVLLELNVDGSILGGLIIRIGDRIVDNSVKGKLNIMSKELYNYQLAK